MTDENGDPISFLKWLVRHYPKVLLTVIALLAGWTGNGLTTSTALHHSFDSLRVSVERNDSASVAKRLSFEADHSMIFRTMHTLMIQGCARMTPNEKLYARANNPDFICP